MKNKKGEIATLLTLGLVLVGTLITLGTSFFVNKTKIASNPKAEATLDSCNLPDNDSSCWLVKCINKQPGKIQYTSSLCQSSMPTSSCKGGSPYSGGGKMIIGIDASDDALDDFTCEPGSNTEVEGPGNNLSDTANVPKGCDEKTNCYTRFSATTSGLSSKILISIDNTAQLFYKSENCAKGTAVNEIKILRKYCIDASEALTKPTCDDNLSCDVEYKPNGNGNKYAYSDIAGTITYFKGATCYNTPIAVDEPDIKEYCTTPSQKDLDKAEAEAACSGNMLCTNIPDVTGITNTAAVAAYKQVNGVYIYYTTSNCASTSKTNDIVSYCNNQPKPKPPDPFEYVVKDVDPSGYVCNLIPKELYEKNYKISGDLTGFIKKCQTKATEYNTCSQVIVSDLGQDVFTYMNCCSRTCP